MTAAWLLCVVLLLAVSCAAVDADVKQAKLAEIVAELDGNSDLSDATVASLQRKVAELRHPTAHHTFQQSLAGGKPSRPDVSALLHPSELVSEQVQFVTNFTLTDIRLMTFKLRSSGRSSKSGPLMANVVAALDTEHVLHLYAEDGVHTSATPLGLAPDAVVTAVGFDGKEPISPIIVIGASDGSLLTVFLDIFHTTKLVAGRGKRRNIAKNQANTGFSGITALARVHSHSNMRDPNVLCSRMGGTCVYVEPVEQGEGADEGPDAAGPGAGSGTVKSKSKGKGKGAAPVVVTEDVRPSNANGKYVVPSESFVGDLPRRDGRYATAVHVYQKANEPRGNVIVVGDNYGTIVSVFDDGRPNSGQRNFLDTHDSRLRTSEAEAPLLAMTTALRAPVLDFARVGQILVVATGEGMKLVHVGRFRPYGYDCENAAGTVTRIVTDPQNAMVLYAMTVGGDISVFHVKHKAEGVPDSCFASVHIRPDGSDYAGGGPASASALRQWQSAADAGVPRQSFANVKGMMVAAGDCGLSLYAARTPGQEGGQSRGFLWTPLQGMFSRVTATARHVATRVKGAIGAGPRLPTALEGTAVHTQQPVKKLGKAAPLSDLLVYGYNAYLADVPSKARPKYVLGGKLPALVGIVTLYKSISSARGALSLAGGGGSSSMEDDFMPSITKNINWIRPFMIIVVVFFATFKMGRDKARRKKVLDGEEDEDDEGWVSWLFNVLNPFGQTQRDRRHKGGSNNKRGREAILASEIGLSEAAINRHAGGSSSGGSGGAAAAAVLQQSVQQSAQKQAELRAMESMLLEQQSKYQALTAQLEEAERMLDSKEREKASARGSAAPVPAPASASAPSSSQQQQQQLTMSEAETEASTTAVMEDEIEHVSLSADQSEQQKKRHQLFQEQLDDLPDDDHDHDHDHDDHDVGTVRDDGGRAAQQQAQTEIDLDLEVDAELAHVTKALGLGLGHSGSGSGRGDYPDSPDSDRDPSRDSPSPTWSTRVSPTKEQGGCGPRSMLEPVTSAEINMAEMAMAGMDAASAQLRKRAGHRSSTEWDGDELSTMLREELARDGAEEMDSTGVGSPLTDIDAVLSQLSSQLKEDARLPDTPDR